MVFLIIPIINILLSEPEILDQNTLSPPTSWRWNRRRKTELELTQLFSHVNQDSPLFFRLKIFFKIDVCD